jgi:hypothetical protein
VPTKPRSASGVKPTTATARSSGASRRTHTSDISGSKRQPAAPSSPRKTSLRTHAVHFTVVSDKVIAPACCSSTNVSHPERYTTDTSKVTCKNCKRTVDFGHAKSVSASAARLEAVDGLPLAARVARLNECQADIAGALAAEERALATTPVPAAGAVPKYHVLPGRKGVLGLSIGGEIFIAEQGSPALNEALARNVAASDAEANKSAVPPMESPARRITHWAGHIGNRTVLVETLDGHLEVLVRVVGQPDWKHATPGIWAEALHTALDEKPELADLLREQLCANGANPPPQVTVDLTAPADLEDLEKKAEAPAYLFDGPVHLATGGKQMSATFACAATKGRGSVDHTDVDCEACTATEAYDSEVANLDLDLEEMEEDERADEATAEHDRSSARTWYALTHQTDLEEDPTTHGERKARLAELLESIGVEARGLERWAKWSLEQRLAFEVRGRLLAETLCLVGEIQDCGRELHHLEMLKGEAKRLAEPGRELLPMLNAMEDGLAAVVEDVEPVRDAMARLRAADARCEALGIVPMRDSHHMPESSHAAGLAFTLAEEWVALEADVAGLLK